VGKGRCWGEMFERLAAETGKARLPTVVRELLDNMNLNRDGMCATQVR